MKEVLIDMIPFIKFEKLKPLTLATTVAEYELISKEAQLDAFRLRTIKEIESICK